MENRKNNKQYDNNKSGMTGVIYYPYNNTEKWMASIAVNNKRINLGYFDTFEDACAARIKGEVKYYGEYQRVDEHLELLNT